MAFAEKTTERAEGPELFPIALKLDQDAHELMLELMQRTGWDASELVGWALGAYWREMEGIVLPPPPDEDIEKVLAESEADIAAGRTFSNEEVFGPIEIRGQHAWSEADLAAIRRAVAQANRGDLTPQSVVEREINDLLR